MRSTSPSAKLVIGSRRARHSDVASNARPMGATGDAIKKDGRPAPINSTTPASGNAALAGPPLQSNHAIDSMS